MASIEGTSVLYDPDKRRTKELLELVRKTSADGVIFILTKFCDPDEYDYVPVKKLLDANGVPCLLVEVDRQAFGYEQARGAIEAFADMLNKD
jgi:benzoyl-CoA reductase/2-hydroxyglutaryl-CoA dehydratase subunit BcrC/BadD/HgdB